MKAVLLKPLDGREIGSTLDLNQEDFNRLVEMNAVAAPKSTDAKEAKAEAGAPENKAAARAAKR